MSQTARVVQPQLSAVTKFLSRANDGCCAGDSQVSSNRDERPDQSAAGHANVGQRDSGGPDAPGQADGSQEQLAEKDVAIGTVYLVGAGPGSPDLLTLAGLRALQRADVVLYDGLIDPRLLHQAPQAAHVCVGKHGKTPIWTQEDINRRLIEEAQSGRTVVRLKGGDPAVFGRTAEELEALVSAGIPFRVVPGVTAGLAAASYCGIPITHRDHASAVALVTGHQSDSNARDNPLDWHALARFPGTLVVYMGVTTAGEWSKHLIAAGKPATTPVAIVRRCTWPDQKTIRCTLGQVGEVLAPHRRFRPPAVIIVGEVAGEDQR
ncbi:MAG: uroporphyrinogen-III C-methyltransferase, partial [Planctomycetota bacterium]